MIGSFRGVCEGLSVSDLVLVVLMVVLVVGVSVNVFGLWDFIGMVFVGGLVWFVGVFLVEIFTVLMVFWLRHELND